MLGLPATQKAETGSGVGGGGSQNSLARNPSPNKGKMTRDKAQWLESLLRWHEPLALICRTTTNNNNKNSILCPISNGYMSIDSVLHLVKLCYDTSQTKMYVSTL